MARQMAHRQELFLTKTMNVPLATAYYGVHTKACGFASSYHFSFVVVRN